MNDLAVRAAKMVRTGDRYRLVGTNRSVQFLRGVFSRASMCLPAFYYFLGAASSHEYATLTDDYPFKIAQSYAEFSDLNTLTLSCRKMFDHATKPDLTGANFGKVSNAVLEGHARHWVCQSKRSEDECLQALTFLRTFFAEYSKSDSILLKQDGGLHKRIGLMKQHADRAAAHLSLDDYSLAVPDLAHFAASVAIVGEIVRCFDLSHISDDYFNELDEGSHAAAKRVFPELAEFRLFGSMQVRTQARFYWKHQADETVVGFFDQLQAALG